MVSTYSTYGELPKLLAAGLVNLNRVEVLWRPVTNHLLEVIIHPLNRLREWGIDVITTLVRSVIQYDYSTPLKENQRLQTLLISPLNELSSTSFADVQQKQVDCVLHLLHSSGDIISFGWPLFLNIIGAINNSQGKLSLNLERLDIGYLQSCTAIKDFDLDPNDAPKV
ncbi:hypothetical protein OUZ56_027750 [Daphnia magna]|uniref:Mon2/Sec7/BIG1-like HDS domain-containing protein n=1 Tax=Daphnia magna TaxID=35525 RepID=A0ABR0B1T9_9CRUS|nr:hypothetical protein OUZ56_027750 [Daphnia magna]